MLNDKLNITFHNPALLELAFTHPSVNQQDKAGNAVHYQRLEFLGDSILGAVVSHLLYTHYPNETEGQLAQRKSTLVSGKMLVQVMQTLELAEHIIMSDAELATQGQQNKSVQEDVCEALIGAIYLDQGFDAAFTFVQTHWLEAVQSAKPAQKDAKTGLQEYVQSFGLPLPEYHLVAQSGSAHAPQFTIAVRVQGQVETTAEAGNKRKAEQLAARAMLNQMGATNA